MQSVTFLSKRRNVIFFFALVFNNQDITISFNIYFIIFEHNFSFLCVFCIFMGSNGFNKPFEIETFARWTWLTTVSILMALFYQNVFICNDFATLSCKYLFKNGQVRANWILILEYLIETIESARDRWNCIVQCF